MLKTAIIGCGRIADLHELGYRGREDARIVAVCDTNRRAAEAKAAAWGVARVTTDYEEVLADPAVDLVELLVPHHLHAEMTVAACRAGKHVSVQKPMALTLAEADRMIAAAALAGVTLRVYENFVCYPPHVKARELLDAGEIGAPRMIRLHVNTGKSKTGWKVPLSAWRWRFDENRSGGGPLVFDHGYHLFSQAVDLMGPVTEVAAWIDRTTVVPGLAAVDAPATIMLRFAKGGRYGVMDFVHTPKMVMDSPYYADDDRVEIIGEKGIIQINRGTALALDVPPVVLFRDGETRAIPVERVDWSQGFVDCTRHLLDALATGGQPKLDGATGRHVLAAALAALASARDGGRPVAV
jgi:predicted dehydrogenase